ncbi:hypothetical protein [Streptomyces gobiensis]|uniref:hypothetical protein n=1 Tax=Streptomyces gobiensis TaxID=2875706 RepID=UPI001E4CD9A2|nr:hypothetical protein [Streptomyces gobiensis]UGY90818.1 hypothetical protein test1122_03160 [Streptomyces gobiensis]
MDTLRNRAESQKIARLLSIDDPEELAFLRTLPAGELRRFREQTAAALHDRAPDLLDRIARATKLVPTAVAAAISQKALGPQLAAAVAGRLEPARAADIIDKLPVSFTAQACAHLDPRRIQDIVDRLDEDLVVRIAVTLAERADHLTMGRFVGHLRDAALERIITLIDDPAILRIGYFIDTPERLDPVLALLGSERLESLIGSAADGLWPEALAVAAMASGERRAEIAALAAHQPEPRLDSLVRAAHEQDLWESLLPLVALLNDDDRRTVAVLPALRDESVLGEIVRAVATTGLWAEFLPLAQLLPEPSRHSVAAAAGRLPDTDLAAMALEVAKQDLWDAVIPLVELMDDPTKERIFALPAFQNQAG